MGRAISGALWLAAYVLVAAQALGTLMAALV